MKLLFDPNISHRVLFRLSGTIPEAKHVRDFDLQFSTDRQIWEFAKENGFAIVTFDADFGELATLYGHPPKIIWLRFGNTTTQYLAEKLAAKSDVILEFLNNSIHVNIAVLEMDD